MSTPTDSLTEYATPSPQQQSPVGRLIGWCLHNKLVMGLFVLLMVGWGLLVLPFDVELPLVQRRPIPTDAIPDIGENQQIVFTQWMGRSPQDVEDQITYPLTVALLGVPEVKTIRSLSMFGFSTIYVIFDESAEFYWSRSRLLEKLNSLPAGTLPAGVQPALGPDATALGQIYWYTLEGRDELARPAGGWDLEELRTIQDWTVRYALLSAEGVADVGSVGGFVREYQVDVDPDAMRAYAVTLPEIHHAVQGSNIDVGARTIEVNRAEYFIRGIGFVKEVDDIADAVVAVRENVPILVRHVATVSLGPAPRRGALDKDGAEAVGGVVVARYGANPLAVIKNTKAAIERVGPGLPAKVLIDSTKANRDEVAAYARRHGFVAHDGDEPDHAAWVKHLRATPRDQRPKWATISQVAIVPFYDRTGLIYETLGTLSDALQQEILITFIVVILMVAHLRISALIGSMLPLTVLICFVAMKTFGVDANIVALSGIAIAIGTIVDMGIVIGENILRHLNEAPPDAPRLAVVHRAASEVGSAVLTAVATTVVSFLPVFAMSGEAGKLFRPLAFTKTFALIGSIVIALTILPPAAYLLFGKPVRRAAVRILLYGALAIAGAALGVHGILLGSWLIVAAGGALLGFAVFGLLAGLLPAWLAKAGPMAANIAVVVLVGVLLTKMWEPLGPQRGAWRNLLFVGGLIGGLLGFFRLFQWIYPAVLGWCLRYKELFLLLPAGVVILGFMVYVGFAGVLSWAVIGLMLAGATGVGMWTYLGSRRDALSGRYRRLLWRLPAGVLAIAGLVFLAVGFGYIARPAEIGQPAERGGIVRQTYFWARGTAAFPGLGKEFMPPLDEGSFLFMPTTMTHASIGEALDVLAKQDMAFQAIPEIESAVGKIGRAETPLDPAPISMVETVITYKPEYKVDENGRRLTFRYDRAKGEFVRNAAGELIEDPDGRAFRQWRFHIRDADDIWKEIVKAGQIDGTTSAPRLQPIAARLVMLQSGMRAPMGVKVKGPTLEAIEDVGLQLERLLKQVPSVEPAAVVADRIVGKPYLEIVPDRRALARYGVKIRQFQDIVEVAIGGMPVTTTVEGRERFAVRVRYQRELRDTIETMRKILVPGKGGTQIPLEQVAEVRYVRGPQVIKSEDTQLVGYVLFDKKPGHAEVDVVEEAKAFLKAKFESGELTLPAGVPFPEFAGSYESQVRFRRTLMLILPLALLVIFLILYFQFHSVSTALLVFSGIFVAWAGGFLLIWLYGQSWFLDFALFSVNMRDLFQVHTINMSVAVWVGFLALFGIATDNGVIQSAYLNQVFRERAPEQIREIREATIVAARRRIRPCLMTTATTILALLPVLTSTGRGSDVMVPMAIPSFGGMLVVLLSVFVVPVLYCWVAEARLAGRATV